MVYGLVYCASQSGYQCGLLSVLTHRFMVSKRVACLLVAESREYVLLKLAQTSGAMGQSGSKLSAGTVSVTIDQASALGNDLEYPMTFMFLLLAELVSVTTA